MWVRAEHLLHQEAVFGLLGQAVLGGDVVLPVRLQGAQKSRKVHGPAGFPGAAAAALHQGHAPVLAAVSRASL